MDQSVYGDYRIIVNTKTNGRIIMLELLDIFVPPYPTAIVDPAVGLINFDCTYGENELNIVFGERKDTYQVFVRENTMIIKEREASFTALDEPLLFIGPDGSRHKIKANKSL